MQIISICMKFQILFSVKNKKKYYQIFVCWISSESDNGLSKQ